MDEVMKLTNKLPVDTSENERWFSLMNRLKSKWRNRLSQKLLNDLMFTCCHGPDKLEDVNLDKALLKWKALCSNERGRYYAKWKEDDGLRNVVKDMQAEAKLMSW